MIKVLDGQNDFTGLRIRSQKNEILVMPEREYTLFVVQKA